MKVITEGKLREIINGIDKTIDNKFPNGGYIADMTRSSTKACLESLLSDGFMEEIDTLTVSKLRPMCEARDEEDAFDKSILVSYVGCPGVFHVVEQNGSNYWSDGEDDYHSDSEFIGWIPMPIYKPEQP